mmetsp:Transcript_65059/g.157422  ORF Transcript_65059/g.157422 Transcript_65059/m.157422 type:complete len:270 (-) Transcript_65059:50-859(-)
MQLFVGEVAGLQFEKWSFLHLACFAFFSGLGSKVLEWPPLWAEATWCGGRPFRFGRIPPGGKIRGDDELTALDAFYGGINRFIVGPFYFCSMAWFLQHCQLDWSLNWFMPVWALAQCLALFAIYDSVYTPLHRLAHLRCVYGWCHKHHHRQLVPYRGTFDAVNEHPLELFLGAFLHIFAIRALQWLFLAVSFKVHVLACGAFLAASVLLGSLNHTRWDVNIPKVFSVRDHDTHHRVFTANYGQYTTWIDKMTGTYQPFFSTSKSPSETQ